MLSPFIPLLSFTNFHVVLIVIPLPISIIVFVVYCASQCLDIVYAVSCIILYLRLPSGKRLHNYGKSPCSMGKSTISMAIFNSYVTNYRRVISLFLFTISRIISHAVPEGRISQSASDVNELHKWSSKQFNPEVQSILPAYLLGGSSHLYSKSS